MRLLFRFFMLCMLSGAGLAGHPMPNSVLLLDIKPDGISAELQWPLKELQLAFPQEDIDVHSATLIARKGAWLDDYLHVHMSVADSAGRAWTITVNSKKIDSNEQSYTGAFHELVFRLWLQPPPGVSPRHFIMHYDAIMHQVVTHKMLIRIRNDWDGGLSAKDSSDAELGMLMMNISSNIVPPLVVNLDEGSAWKGFKTMVLLGISHITEGTDHLLFLLVLLLPAPLLVKNSRWYGFGGTRYSVIRLVKIATAFTLGHSISLLLGAMKILVLPQQPVEVAIAVTVFITAIHALRPLFPGREIIIAAGFGLVHGLAFATVLTNLDLGAGRMALSILGFNIGIELMQLFVILCTMPWLIMLAKGKSYNWLRIAGAVIAIVASLAWIAERVTQRPNAVSEAVQKAAVQSKWLVLFLAVLALLSGIWNRLRVKNAS